ncbi:MAG: DUF5009 domain-containing protein [Bacteroidetes bacterium]|nr:MAG: DUF5009 domain-containing protein [Bacteroidota bacterium]
MKFSALYLLGRPRRLQVLITKINTSTLTYRNLSLDALRGIAILGMVLSGSIAYGPALPAWMFHAQVPPPNHVFIPSLPGITWVDLVFPFFLFSMGAALPLSLSKKLGVVSTVPLVISIVKRFLLLSWFAFYFEHVQIHLLSHQYALWQKWANALFSFLVLWGIFNAIAHKKRPWLGQAVQYAALAISVVQVSLLSFQDGKAFNLARVDIIILVLANMALFGSFIWWATRRQPWLRLGLLPMVMAIFLSAKQPDSWQSWLFTLTPSNQVYQFYFLKYLFIIVPGTIAGEWLLANAKPHANAAPKPMIGLQVSAIALLLTVSNLVFLLNRSLTLNAMVSLLAGIALLWRCKHYAYQQLVQWGVYLLWLGLAFEAYEGGIKKDFSTYSYYFVCSGLAFLWLVVLSELQGWKKTAPGARFLAGVGQNPLVAYVAGGLVVTPLLGFVGLLPYWQAMNGNALAGFLKGFLFTGAVALLTAWFTHKKWFWKS